MPCTPWVPGMLSRKKAADRFQQEVWDSLPAVGYLLGEIQAPRMKPHDWDRFKTARANPQIGDICKVNFKTPEAGARMP